MLTDIIKNKRVVFITTKNIDYIRNSQEIRLIKESSLSYSLIYSDKKSYPARLLEIFKKLMLDKKEVSSCEVVFVGFAPQLILPFLYRQFEGKKVVIDFFISVYDTLVMDRAVFKDKGLLAKICRSLDERTLCLADNIITDTKAQAAFFIDEFKVDSQKVETLYLEADSTIYYPRQQKKNKELQGKYVVLYFGSILPLQGVDVVLDAIKILKDEKDIFFEVIGPISSKYEKPIQENVQYYEWLSQEELANHIAHADVCLAGHFNAGIEKANRTIPGKAYIYEEMGKKMILGDSKANREIFVEDDKHLFAKMGNPDSICESIQKAKFMNSSERDNIRMII